MQWDDSAQLKERIAAFAHRRLRDAVAVIDHAQNYAAILPGMVLRLEAGDFYILSEAREGRFGIDEQPKLWVKYAIDLSDGSRKIVKLPFLESFETSVGHFRLRCARNPDKESRVLAAVAGDPRFMHGVTVHDRLGHNIRIIEEIRGRSLYRYLSELTMDHERYFHELLPGVLAAVLGCIEALGFLHRLGEQHGDVRNDHIWIESETGRYRWIDFDYEANFLDYDIWSLGNVLAFAVGKGILTCRAARQMEREQGLAECIQPDDAMVFFDHRLANLRKVFPYIPVALNRILMRFSQSTVDFYESVAEIAADLRAALAALPGPSAP